VIDYLIFRFIIF